MLVLFGVLVDYDEYGAPVPVESEVESNDDHPPASGQAIQTYYPRTLYV